MIMIQIYYLTKKKIPSFIDISSSKSEYEIIQNENNRNDINNPNEDDKTIIKMVVIIIIKKILEIIYLLNIIELCLY